MSTLRIIADVHGKTNEFLKLLDDCEYCIQLGDFGFDYSCLNDIDPNKLKIIPGNHDNYDEVDNFPHFLKTYGQVEHGGLKFFYVRGAFSVDRQWREHQYFYKGEKTIWDNEELSLEELFYCAREYSIDQPDLVLTHECPANIMMGGDISRLGYSTSFNSRTQIAMECMLRLHQPKMWIFGHWHTDMRREIGKTQFRCLDELQYIDLDPNDL